MDIGISLQGILVSDLNQDGFEDIAVLCGTLDDVAVFLGNGDGSFQEHVSYVVVGGLPTSIASEDLNLDGSPDLAVVNQSQGNVSILIHK